jgi:glycosyltransferase involved in cell wall biosynthesis
MSAGKTVVLSRNESHAAVIRDGENGLLFEPDKPQELATQILRAINDDELRSKLSRSARRLCEEQFSNSVVASHLENLYIKAIG